jgi:hypothetical protein
MKEAVPSKKNQYIPEHLKPFFGDVDFDNLSVSKRSRNFWALLLDMKEESCTVKRYPSPFGDCSWE